MASSDRTPDMSRVISDLSRAINQLVDKVDNLGGSGSHGGRGSSGAGGRAKSGDLDLKGTQKSFKELTAQMNLTEKTIRDMRRGFNDTTQSFDHLYRVQNEAAKGLIRNQNLSERAQQNLVNSINNSIRGHSFLGQSMANAGKKVEFLEQKLEETGKFLSQYTDILKDANAQSLSSITDHAQLQKVLKKLNSEMVLSEDVQEMIRRKEFARAAQTLDDEAKNANTIRASIRRTSQKFNQLNAVTDGLRAGVSKATDAIGAGFVKEAAQWGGALGLIAGGAKQAYNQFWQTASAGFGGAFIQLSGTAIGLGISLESLTKITKENMNLVGKMGLKGFTNSLKETQIQLMQLGLTTEEAARARAAMNKNAFLTGVDIKNKQALSIATQQQISSYENMRAVTGESIEALAEQTTAILKDADATKIMGTLNKQQRTQLMTGINLERQRLVTMGLTNEAAIGVVKSLQAIQNMKATDRVETGYNLMAAGSALGIDATRSAKAAGVLQKGRTASEDDKKFLADYAREVAAKQDRLQGGDLNNQMLGNLTEDWTAVLAPVTDGMREANLDRGLSPEEVEANKAMGRVPAVIAEGSAKIESAMRVLESPLTKIMVGVLGIGALLVKQFMKKPAKTTIPNDTSGSDGPDLNGPDSPIDGRPGRGAQPGDSVHGPERMNSQMTEVAKKHGWKEKQLIQERGLTGNQQLTRQIQEQKAERTRRATDAGRQQGNTQSIGSEALQERRRINAEMVRERLERENQLQGPPRPPRRRTTADRIDAFSERSGRRTQELTRRARTVISERRDQTVERINGFGSRTADRIRNSDSGQTAGALGRAGRATAGRVTGAVGGVASAGLNAVRGAAGGIMNFGAKALPFIGIAIAGIQALSGAFDAVKRAGEIFGVDTTKQALTTSQKVSAGIAGALETISFGLIPTDATARLLNDVATDGVAVLTDYAEGAVEWIANNGIPALYSAFKNVMGFIGGAIVDVLSPSTWIAAFTGEGGNGGMVQSIISSLYKGLQFLGTALMKGAIKVGTDMVEGMINLIPDWAGGKALKEKFAKAKAESEKGGALGFAATDTKFSDFDSKEDAAKRKAREAKKAARDKKGDKTTGTDGASADKVQGTATTAGGDNLGMVKEFGQELTADQLAAQGVQGRPATSNSPGVNGPNGQAPAASQDASGGGINTDAKKEPSKSAEEVVLDNILGKMTELVELTNKGLNVTTDGFKAMTTQQRVANQAQPGQAGFGGYAPSLASFMNSPM